MPSTRRAALGAAAGALSACLAGCGALTGSERSSSHVPDYGAPVTDYETERFVLPEERRLFHWTGDDDRSDQQLFLTTADERDAVAFDVPGASAVEGFVAKTDMSAASLALFQRRHSACREFGISRITRRPDELRVHLCQATRPADDPCRTGVQHSTALAIRVPRGEEPASELSVTTRSECVDRFGPYRDGRAN